MWLPCCVAVVIAFWRGACAADAIWLVGIQPFTGGAWDAGISMRFGAEIMLEEVAKNTNLLPGYELQVVWQDGRCAGETGREVFLTNVFDKEYRVFAPNASVDELDVDRDGVITSADVEPFGANWSQADVSPDPVALLGTGCSSASMKISRTAYKARFPMVSNSASNPDLSDRAAYPNFFRTVMPDTTFNAAWLALARSVGISTATVVLGELDLWGAMAGVLAVEAASAGVALKGDDLTQKVNGLRGMVVRLDDKEMAKSAARGLVRYRQRVVILLNYHPRSRLVMCEAFKLGFVNAVYMTFGWHPFGWWAYNTTDCSPEDLTNQAVGLISANMLFHRSDLDTQLSCSATMSAGQFIAEWYRRQGADPGDLTMRPEGYAIALEAATPADAVCMLAMALHQVLFVDGVPLSELTARTKLGYRKVIDQLSTADFEGVQGRVRFIPGKADPEGSVILQQLQRGAGEALQLLDVATYTNPYLSFLGKGDLAFQFPTERFQAGPAGASQLTGVLTQFKICPLITEFATNECIGCPTSMEYVQLTGACLCIAGYFLSSTGGCSPCPGGTFSKIAGTVECELCKAGMYAPIGSRSCTFCPRGTYADTAGISSCTSCPQLQTTENIASQSHLACICDFGSFQEGTGFFENYVLGVICFYVFCFSESNISK